MKKTKNILSVILALCMLSMLSPAALAAGGFTDVPDDAPYADAVLWASENGVTVGKSDTSFAPDDTLSRAEAVTFLWRVCGSPEPSGGDTAFTDLSGDAYTDAVKWAYETGVTNGVSSTEFAPELPVTRTQMAAFIYRAMGEPGRTGSGEWYSDAVKWAFDHPVIFGCALPMGSADGDLCLRSDAAEYLYRAFTAPEPEDNGDVIILYTADVHCGIDLGFGYAGLYEIRAALEQQGYETILVDGGDSVQGEPIGTLSRGEALIDLMNAAGYDAAIPGNHDFTYGMDRFFELTEQAEFPYISCNFNKEGEPVFEPYIMLEASGMKIAFVGVATPDTVRSSTPAFFQNDDGEFIYGFCGDSDGKALYAAVQSAADAAAADGADFVYVLAHLGNEPDCVPWTYADVLGNTVGIDVLFDAHSHDSEQIVMKNAAGESVVRSACGTKLSGIGYSRISSDGKTVATGVWSWTNPVCAADLLGISSPVGDKVAEAKETFKTRLEEVVARSSVLLTVHDPEAKEPDGSPLRLVRRAETNFGDLCADAFRAAGGADIGLINGGAIRRDLQQGDVTYADIINVFPFGNQLCVIEATGQQILDALEWGTRAAPGLLGAFPQVSGMSYELDVSVPDCCTADENGMFTGAAGPRRVKNVTVGGEPLDPGRTYTLASIDYLLLKHGDGYTMFDGCTLLLDRVEADYQLLIDYIAGAPGGEVGEEYENIFGQGRITVLGAED